MLKKLIFCWVLLFGTILAFAQEFPAKPSTLFYDYTNTIPVEAQGALERKLEGFNDSTSSQLAVVIMRSVGSYDINQYTALLGRKWGVGQKGKNNGVVLLVALDDRKVAIQTGYGMEGALPDAITHEIIENDIKPRFKVKDYYGGLNAAIDDIIKYTKGEYKSDASAGGGKGKSNGAPIGFIIIIVIVIIIAVFRRRGGGGGGHIIGSRGGASPFWWFLAGQALGSSGRSSGSDWGGFSGGGGGSSGGGFGGFGGGSFGGGGSSGSW